MNSIYSTPDNPDIKVWRYLDFAKFVSLLDSKSLFFSRADLLGDDYEFTYPKSNHSAFDGTPQSSNNEFFLQTLKVLRKSIFVNCWQINDHESTAMWNEYLKNDNGLAIQTTFRNLLEELKKCSYKSRLDMGLVNYIDYEVDKIVGQNILEFIFHKRVEFTHEKEMRAVIWKTTSDNLVIDPFAMTEPESAESGLIISVSLNSLIEKIIIAPKAPIWFKNLVESVCEKYELNCPIIQSRLSAPPLK